MTVTYTKQPLSSMVIRRGRILTDLLAQILVGENEDEILIYQTDGELYSRTALATNSFTKQPL